MRFMFIARPQQPVPPELGPDLVEGFVSWWERYRDRWESAGFFAGGGGGGGICNVADEAEFHRMMLEWPFTPFSQIETHALLNVDTALSQWQQVFAARGQGGT